MARTDHTLDPAGGVALAHPKLQQAAQEAILGKRRGLCALLPFLGPAFIACVAYVDPGNFATNISGGAEFGYALLWVIAMANLMAMLIQSMSAKLGIATGHNLAEMCREHFPTWVNYTLWLSQEFMAMATDLAEFLGAAIGLYLLFGIPMIWAGLLTGIGVFLVLAVQGNGFRGMEIFITLMVGIIVGCYVIETVLAKPNFGQILFHTVVPSLPGNDAVLLSVGIIGATVMPHVVYLHSGLTQNRIQVRNDDEKLRVFFFEKIDVVVAMAIAGLVNMSMLFMAAKVFHFTGHTDVADITTAYQTLTPLLGGAASLVFAISLLFSGISSSHVGTMAGQVVMQGFVGFRIPIWVRRLFTMVPALAAILLGLDPTRTLVISQVILSFALPVPMITLIMFTRRRDLMGVLTNHRVTTILAWAFATVILFLNFVLLYQTFGGPLPSFG